MRSIRNPPPPCAGVAITYLYRCRKGRILHQLDLLALLQKSFSFLSLLVVCPRSELREFLRLLALLFEAVCALLRFFESALGGFFVLGSRVLAHEHLGVLTLGEEGVC
jgi:hypothetical protein